MTQPHTSLSLYRRVFAYLRPYSRQFILAVLCMVVFGATEGLLPFLVQHILDGVFAKLNKHLLYSLPFILVGFALIRAAADFGQQFLMARVGHNVVFDLRNEVFAKVLQFSPSYFLRRSGADIVSRMTNDILLVRSLLTDSAAAIIRDSVRIVALLIAAIYLDPILACAAFLLFPIGIFPVYRFGKKLRALSRIGQDSIGIISSRLDAAITGNRVVKIFSRESYERRRFREENESLTKTFVRSERFRALTGPVNEILASVAISGVILYGGYSVISGLRTQGEFIAFLLSVFLLYDPFKKLSRLHGNVQQAMSGVERIFEVLDAEVDIKSSVDTLKKPSADDIVFDNVSFAYQGSEKPALHKINLEIKAHAKVALIGFSGAGKTTLVDLLVRFIDPLEGSVQIGGIDIRRITLADLREKIAMVSQHTFLFNDTAFNNIAYGREGASPEEVVAAAKAAYADDFIRAMPHGYNTMVGEGGFALSGGERQRISIARAILKNAPILVLDEATAQLDNRSEREVQTALDMLMTNRTTIIIAHRLSTVRNVDRIVVLRDGKIIEEGNHQELLARDGEYAKLYSLQFSEGEDPRAHEILIN